MLRLARDLAAAIAFVTAVVGFAKLIYEGWPSFSDVLPWLGGPFLVALWLAPAYRLIRPDSEVKRLWVVLWLVGFAIVLVPGLYADRDELNGVLSIVAVSGLLGGVLLAAIYYVEWLRKRPAMRPCPHCLENVKEEASVCRHCGRDLPA
jgi:membrane associated rhomboid family serine protease